MSLREVLASFDHIDLTDDEYCEALIGAKRKKEAKIKEQERALKAQETRRMLTARNWSYEQTRDFMLHRAKTLFNDPAKPFVLDEYNEPVFDLLCHYFSESKEFVNVAAKMKVKNPSLQKGLLLAGNYGTGKTWLMSLFRKNNRQVYHVEHAKEVAKAFHKNGEEAIERHYNKIKNAFQDPVVLYQEYSGLCMEDIGREDIKNSYGNRTNVIGDIMEARYINKCMGPFFHGTTNFTVPQLEEFYGGMVVDRLRECNNLIELGGPSRRK